mmetsp:Transcript_11324/g.12446  ORF Transcript_11324/g.12446 Transcript_11324/m.12446 type:complete len:238 (+) Transcript_11324:101-814(+)
MGAMSCIMYMIFKRLEHKPHHISRAVLLSPAGYFKTAPIIMKIGGPIINAILPWIPLYSFRFPSEFIQLLIAKIMEDVNSAYPTRTIASYIAYQLLGGRKDKHAFVTTHGITHNIFAGTSVGVYSHFWQLWRTKTFQAFDYGEKKNLQVYGTKEPLNFFKHYDKIDVPVYIAMGLRDRLITPPSVLLHYSILNAAKPELAHIKAFPYLGHIDFTLQVHHDLHQYVFKALKGQDDDTK